MDDRSVLAGSGPSARRLAEAAARLQSSPLPNLLFINHHRGGGTDKYARELADIVRARANVLLLRPCNDGHTTLHALFEDEPFQLFFRLPQEYADLCLVLRTIGIDRIHFHHVLDLHPIVRQLPAELGVAYDYTASDFYPYCPQVTLTGPDERYCGEPDVAGCRECLRIRPAQDGVHIETWRRQNGDFLTMAERVFTHSEAVARRLRHHFPKSNVIAVPPLEPDTECFDLVRRPERLGAKEPFRIAVLGSLSASKGADLLEACARDARRRKLPLDFHLIGYAYRDLRAAPRYPLVVHGRYRESDLPALLARVRPHVLWFPAQAPETYCYALSGALRSGLPIAATDLGAFPERLAGRAWTWVRPWKQDAVEWNDFFVQSAERHFRGGVEPSVCGGNKPRYGFSYVAEYLCSERRPVGDRPQLSVEFLQTYARPRPTLRERIWAMLRVNDIPPLALLRKKVRKLPFAWQLRIKRLFSGHH